MPRHQRTVQFLAIVAVWALLFFGCDDNPVNTNPSPYADMELEVYRLINAHRDSLGLDTLVWSETIAAQCRNHSNTMAATGDLNHDGFTDRITTISQTIPTYNSAENVAYNRTAQGAVTSWLNSSGHKKNIEGNFTMTGIGVALRGSNTYYFTQIFINAK